MTCKYRMVDANMKYWQTDCGRKIRHKKQGWNYCPYCGKEIGWVRSDLVEADHERKD